MTIFLPLAATAEDNTPKVSPTANYLDAENTWQETTSIDDGEAPLEVTFRANPQNMDGHDVAYVWHFRKQGEEGDFLVRYEEETTYRFTESGSFDITLKYQISDLGIEDSTTIVVAISESHLEMPNAFSPNDDGFNDIYGAKGVNDSNASGHYKSIVSFHGYIFNRWGQKLFEWTDVSKGWDGKYNGRDVKDGVYYVLVKAKGADGREYNIRKDINLLRGYTSESTGNSTTTTE